MPLVLQTERLLLRLAEPCDLDALAEMYADPEVARYTSGVTRSRDEVEAMLGGWATHWERYDVGLLAVERAEDGAVVGRVGFLVWDPVTWEHGLNVELDAPYETEIGWSIIRRHWGHGYATEASLAARDWVLREVRPPQLVSLIHPENERSQRVAEKLGERYDRDVVPADGGPTQLWSTR
jgi:RimJ/RimL family protein N-acetyltransferase